MKKTIFKKSILTLCAMCFMCIGLLSGCNFWNSVKPSTNASNFMSRDTVVYSSINGHDVTVDTFYRDPGEALNNPNVGQGIMLSQCIKYKEAHPNEEVYATLTSFHLSVVASVCVDPNSKYYGYMKSLYNSDYDSDGFVRLSYLLIQAAKKGINVTVIGQIDASPVMQGLFPRNDYDFEEYFLSHQNDACELEGKVVRDYMNFKKCHWTSYGDKSASDMMHLKSCSVSHYIDKNGVEHNGAIWLGSINVDGIDGNGVNQNNGVQTGIIVSDHQPLRRIVYNFTNLMSNYCNQEGISEFRDLVATKNKEQIDLIKAGKESQIPADEQIVYLGSECDKVFELYFTPFGGSVGAWTEYDYNPYSKYINKLLPVTSGKGAITFAWNNVKFLTNFEYSKTLAQVVKTAFVENGRLTNKLYMHLPGIDTKLYDQLVVGENIGKKMVNKNLGKAYHSKDLQLSYMEYGIRHYVTLFNSLNFHQGAMSYQINSVLVVNETNATGNDTYISLGSRSTEGVISETDRVEKK